MVLHEVFDVIERVAEIVEVEEGFVGSGSGVNLIRVLHELRQHQIVLQLFLRRLRRGREGEGERGMNHVNNRVAITAKEGLGQTSMNLTLDQQP